MIRVFGTAAVDGDGVLAGRDRQVLAALVVTRARGCAADRLADALYGDAPPATWRKVVQRSVVRLRRALGRRAIETTADGYRLVIGDDQIDVGRFERLVGRARELRGAGAPDRAALAFQEALELAADDPLRDLDGWDPARAEATRLGELRLGAQDELVEAFLEAGRHREAMALAAALVEAEPLREQRWAALALSQYRSGRQADALRTIRRGGHQLVEELGLDPGPELAQLEGAILAQDPMLAGEDAAASLATSVVCPYRGLSGYDTTDAELFFGRDSAVEECLDRLARRGFVAVVGPSGCGKSSLARAGIAPGLVRHGVTASIITPGTEPTARLAATPPVGALVVDQLEELFTQCGDADERARFVRELDLRAATEPVIVTLRSDHLASIAEHPRLAARVEQGLYLLRPMDEDDLRAAIEGPARWAGLALEPGLVEMLLHDVAGQPGALPLLSHVLTEVWAQRDGRVLTAAAYQAAGGLRGAVAQTAERTMRSLPPDGQDIARDLFLRLVAVADGAPVRLRRSVADLAIDPSHERVLNALFEARLLTVDEDTAQVAHEALAVAWPRLQTWLDEDQEGQRILQHLAATSAGWVALDHDDAELYRGSRLSQALDWAESHNPALTPTERGFLDASRRKHDDDHHRQRRTNRRLRNLLTAVVVALVLALAASTAAVVQRNQAAATAEAAETARMVATTNFLAESDHQAALLLAVEAYERDPSVDAVGALQTALTTRPGFLGYLAVDGTPQRVEIADDGSIVVGTTDRGIQIFDPSDHSLRRTIAYEGLGYVATSPDGDRVATTDGNEVVVFDTATGDATARFAPRSVAGPEGLWYAPNGELLVASAGGGLAIHAADGATLGELPTDLEVQSLAFSNDGRLLAAGTLDPSGVHVWDYPSRVELPRAEGLGTPDGPGAHSVAFSSDDAHLAAGFPSGHVVLWDLTTVPWSVHRLAGSGDPAILVDPETSAFAVRIVDTDPIRVVAMGNGRLDTWDLSETDLVGSRRDPTVPTRSSRAWPSADLALDPRRGTMVTISDHVEVWSTDERELLAQVVGPASVGYVSASTGGDFVVSQRARSSGSIATIDLRTGEERPVTDGAQWGANLGPDDSVLVTASPAQCENGPCSTLQLWDTATLERIGAPVEVPPGLQRRAFSPDGRHLAIGYGASTGVPKSAAPLPANPTDGTIDIFEVTASGLSQTARITAFQEMMSDDYGLWDVLFTSEGRTLVALDDAGEPGNAAIAEWSVPDGELVRTPEQFRDLIPGSARGSSSDGSLYVWRPSGSELALVDQQTLEVRGPRFLSAEGGNYNWARLDAENSVMVTGGADGVTLWDVASRSKIGTPFRHDKGVIPALLPDSSPLGPALLDTTMSRLLAWNIDVGTWPDIACAAAGRNLTPDEWDRYGPDEPYRATCPEWPSGQT